MTVLITISLNDIVSRVKCCIQAGAMEQKKLSLPSIIVTAAETTIERMAVTSRGFGVMKPLGGTLPRPRSIVRCGPLLAPHTSG